MRSVSVLLGVVAAASLSVVSATETTTTTAKPINQTRIPYLESTGNWSKTIETQIQGEEGSKTRGIRVENITLHWPYELRDGQIVFTDPTKTAVPSPGGDFAVLAQTSFRNVHARTGEPVSLDEVYVHHLVTFGSGFGMVGAESLNQVLKFPEGFGFVVLNSSEFGINAHLLSNKNLENVEGSLAIARKQCNECYYAEGKGDLCTPATNGTFACCGDGALMGEHGPIACGLDATQCNCATTTGSTQDSATPYEIQIDFMITRDLDAIQPINVWTMQAPSCYAPVGKGLGVNTSSAEAVVGGGCQPDIEGSTYHNVYRNNTEPEKRTIGRWLAHFDGVARSALGHLHTGGINISFSINGEDICTSHTAYGTQPSSSASFDDEDSANARNEYGHLIDIYDCFNTTTIPDGVPIQAGDLVEVTSYYYVGDDDERLPEGAGGSHLNVMSYMNINFDIRGGEVSEYYELPAQFPGNKSTQLFGPLAITDLI